MKIESIKATCPDCGGDGCLRCEYTGYVYVGVIIYDDEQDDEYFASYLFGGCD